ncbi:hypothetical protein F3N42_09045 [Marinihelvus fidelis]|uniref:Carboxypeptidase regulatory-like domain-containing protein n=1 Tax=Marinihelvus fidelis TaxID=2613842 RepID=A0A5N0TAJ6_9GAMM|nr:hypothetical protein [Marinihelvus fidelis]KAA9131454.1 hypothetical protein F3N42_09045 [Marinihelvus fidelis]
MTQGTWVISLPTGPAAWGLGLLVLVTAVSVYAAWRRLGRRSPARWLLVAVLNIGAALALAAWLAPPQRLASADATVTLLTEGAPTTAERPSGSVFALPGVGIEPGMTRLALAAQLPLRQPGLGHLVVEGHGLDADEWAQLPASVGIDFEPPALEGLVEPAWPRRLFIGEPLGVTGRYHADSPDAVATVTLLDPAGTRVAESSVRAGAAFSLSAVPRATGLYSYRLELHRGDRVIDHAPVNVEVTGGKPVRIGVLQSAPSFETRHLQQWAGGHGSTLSIDTTISRDRRLDQGINRDAGARLSPSWLAELDLLVMDGRRWASLDAGQRDGLESAVADGLGLLLLADDDFEPGTLFARYSLAREAEPRESAHPLVPGFQGDIALPLLGRRLVANDSHTLTADEQGQELEAWHGHGLGRVAISVLRERHRWRTAGRDDLYTAYWGHVLGTLARPDDRGRLAPPSPDSLARPSLVHHICRQTPQATDNTALDIAGRLRVAPVAGGQAIESTLAFNPATGPLGCIAFWPQSSGWHRVDWIAPGTDEPIPQGHEYVHAEDEWRTAGRWARQQATFRRMDHSEPAQVSDPNTARVPLAPDGPWWLFLFCAAALWVERKQDDDQSMAEGRSRGV